jgi:hypothetical protein
LEGGADQLIVAVALPSRAAGVPGADGWPTTVISICASDWRAVVLAPSRAV